MKPIIFCLSLLLAIDICAQRDTTAYDRFPAVQLQQDLDSMYQQLQANHPHLFANRSKKEADKEFARIKKQVNRDMNRLELTRLVAPFIAGFRDGHTFVSVDFDGKDFNRYAVHGGFFPCEVIFMGSKLYALPHQDLKTGMQRADEIISINGKPAAHIIQTLTRLWSADGEANARATAQRLFSFGLWLAYNWGNSNEIIYVRNGKQQKEILAGISKDQLLELMFGASKARQLHLHETHSLAVVEINSYNSVTRSNTFIDSCFEIIKSKGIQHVVLDLRKNGGGNSVIGDYFLAHLTRKQYNTVASKQWKLGPLVKSLNSDHWMYKAVERDRKTYTEKNGFLVSPVFTPQNPSRLKDSTLFTDVSFYLFTSPRTYSSAHMTALAVKCGQLGTIIGEPTGERLDLTGEILEYPLPFSGLVIVIPTASYRTACGDGSQVGVQPDHLVAATIDDIREGKDTCLEQLKKIIEKNPKK